ncbi:MAG: AbrB/MazE/SpoVT family DNA-binding domain-containing protein [Janthinobacterium lividum]
MASVKVKMVDGGRVIVPAAFRKAMGVTKGDTLTMELDGNEVRLRSSKAETMAAIRRLQAYAATLPKSDMLASDELIAERRAEAARE